MDAKNLEREAMTLELADVRDWHLREVDRLNRQQHPFPNDSTVLSALASYHKRMADAIDAHLARAVEPVYQYSFHDGRAAIVWRDCSKELFDSTPRDARRILYTHSPEPARDAKDAARYRWLKEHDNADLLAEDVIDEAIAAMAQEH